MSISLQQLYNEYSTSYKLRVVAGKKGMNGSVSWIHVSEDWTVADFLHGNELVVTTGILSKEENFLLSFCKALVKNKAAGLVVNVGYYINEIEQEVIDYCNSNNFPLLVFPWDIHIVDLSRDICRVIEDEEKNTMIVTSAFKSAILYPESREAYSPSLMRHDYEPNAKYKVMTFCFEPYSDITPNIIVQLQHMLGTYEIRSSIFNIEKNGIIVLTDYTSSQFERLMENLKFYANNFLGKNIVIGIGTDVSSFYSLHISYDRAKLALHQAKLSGQSFAYFDKLRARKLILSITDYDILNSIVEETIQPLIDYDLKHNTDYLQLCRLYIEHNSNVQTIADITFSHRNTINYRMRKIKDLLGCEFENMEEKSYFLMAYYIYDMLHAEKPPADI